MIEDDFISFKEIFFGSTEGILVVDETGKILLANSAAANIFLYTNEELIGISMDGLLPNRLRHHHEKHRQDFKANPSPRRMGVGRDLMALRKDGSEFPVEISLSYSQTNGQFLVMAFIIDITQRKKAEDGLKRSEEQLIVYATELEKKVEARTEALNESIKKLEREVVERKKAEEEARKALERERELNELKTRFVSIASHEFRTPLSTILSSTSLIHQYKQREEFDKQEKHILRIKSSVNHLTGILNDFLSLGKLEEGKLEVMPEDINVIEFLNDVVDELKPSLKEGQHIKLEATHKGMLTSDARFLRNILFNLISNAIKYSDEGKPIVVTASSLDGAFLLSVKDKGLGIPQHEIKHLFERFFRASNATNIQGTGLGLHIVKRYVDLLDGQIKFESKQDEGSTFTVSIPI